MIVTGFDSEEPEIIYFSFSFPPPLRSGSGLRNSVCQPSGAPATSLPALDRDELLVEWALSTWMVNSPKIFPISSSPMICAGREEMAALMIGPLARSGSLHIQCRRGRRGGVCGPSLLVPFWKKMSLLHSAQSIFG